MPSVAVNRKPALTQKFELQIHSFIHSQIFGKDSPVQEKQETRKELGTTKTYGYH